MIWLSIRTLLFFSVPAQVLAQGSPSPQGLEITLGRAGLGENLIPNASIESLEQNRPKGWAWESRNTDATFELVDQARSGAKAVRIANTTPEAPHVYGQMLLLGGLSLIPGETYTLSCYVQSEDPGQAWIGGGDGWWIRLYLDGTEGKWRRFCKTFQARESDAKFPLMVNTDSPTEGFLVDDLKLEKGPHATPFLDPSLASKPVEIVLDVPSEVSANGPEVLFKAFVFLREDAAPGPAEALISGGDGTVLGRAQTQQALQSGLNSLDMRWSLPEALPRRCRLALEVQGMREEASFDLYTLSEVMGLKKACEERLLSLAAKVEQASQASIPADYARAAMAVTRRFSQVALQKSHVGRVRDAVKDFEELLDIMSIQGDRLQRLEGSQEPERTLWRIPDPKIEGIQIRDGNFWAQGAPIMLMGALGYDELCQELDGYKDYGFNVVGDDFDAFSAFDMMTGEGQFDEGVLPRLVKNWDRLRQLNLAIAYNPTLHYFPFWAMERFPDITGGDTVDQLPDWSGLDSHKGKRTKTYGGFFPFAIDSPSLRRFISDYYGKLMPVLKDHPAFHVIWLMNEPTYRSRDAHYIQLFREYCKDKFATSAALNEAWGSAFSSFDEVGIPEGQNTPGQFDWLTFHQDQVAKWFEWLASEIKKHDPKAILSNKPMAWCLLDPQEGIDFEREAELWEIPGCDAGRNPTDDTYSFGWTTAAMLFDFQKSVAPDKPLADHEYHYVHEANVSSEYVRASYFQSALHGLRMSQFWVWSTGQLGEGPTGAGMSHTAWSQPKVAWGTASSALDLRRLTRVISAFPQRPQTFLYVSRPSLYRDHERHKKALIKAYEAANGLDAPVGFATDKMIRSGRLSECKLLIVPSASYVEPDVMAAIQKHFDGRGHVIMMGDSLKNDPYGRPLAPPLNLNGSRLHVAEESQTAESLAKALDRAMDTAQIDRPIRALTPSDAPAWPVECRSAVVDGKRIVTLVGLNKSDMDVRMAGRQRIRGWHDLVSGESGQRDRITVKPLDVRILRLEP